jgi:hypothetical protein
MAACFGILHDDISSRVGLLNAEFDLERETERGLEPRSDMLRGVERDAIKNEIERQLRLIGGTTVGMWLLTLVGETGAFLDHWLRYASWGAVVCALILILATSRTVRLRKDLG